MEIHYPGAEVKAVCFHVCFLRQSHLVEISCSQGVARVGLEPLPDPLASSSQVLELQSPSSVFVWLFVFVVLLFFFLPVLRLTQSLHTLAKHPTLRYTLALFIFFILREISPSCSG